MGSLDGDSKRSHFPIKTAISFVYFVLLRRNFREFRRRYHCSTAVAASGGMGIFRDYFQSVSGAEWRGSGMGVSLGKNFERAFGAFEKEKGKKNQGTTSRRQRKPMLPTLMTGPTLTRLEARKSLVPPLKEPPRNTRTLPDCGPRGSSAGELA